MEDHQRTAIAGVSSTATTCPEIDIVAGCVLFHPQGKNPWSKDYDFRQGLLVRIPAGYPQLKQHKALSC